MVNPIKSLKNSLSQIPTKYRYLTSLGILAALLIALPVTLIGLTTGTFELRKRAVTYEPGPTPTLGPGQVRIYSSTSTHRIGDGGIITISLDNDSRNGIGNIQLFMTFDPRVISFSASDVELEPWLGGVSSVKEVFYASSDKAQFRLVHQLTSNPTGTTIVFIHYKPVAPGMTSLVFENDLKTGTLENKVTSTGSDVNLIKEARSGSVQITGTFDKCRESCGDENDCSGLLCGTPCPPNQACIQELFCYNANCPFDQNCNCFDMPPTLTPTPTPTPTPIACVLEGQTMPVYPGYQCCLGLEAISPNKPDANGNCPDYPLLGASVCVKDCGDGQCTLGENKCNCLEDCGPTSCIKEGEVGVEANSDFCCPGLESISDAQPEPENPGLCRLATGRFVCVKDCGNGQCTFGENKCNCSEDCVHNSLKIKLMFYGVTSRPPDDSNKEVQIYATNLTGGPDLGSATDKKLITLEVDDSGVYSVEIGLDGSYFGHRYRLRIKGPKHLQSVFPDVYFQPGGELNLTEWPLRPGDLNQDGKVDLVDLRSIKVFSKDPADIAFGDVNFDNRVDIFDKVLVLNTLSVQYDPD